MTTKSGKSGKLKLGGSLAKKTVQLIDARRERVAYAVALQMQRSVPSYAEIDTVALAKGNEDTLECLSDLLLRRKTDSLERITHSVAELRGAAGFDPSEFVTAGLAFLPVIRRYLVKVADEPFEGLAMYELVEAMLLPFTGTMLKICLECMAGADDATAPEGIDRVRFLQMLSDSLDQTAEGRPLFEPIPIASLEDEPAAFGADDDDEPTVRARKKSRG